MEKIKSALLLTACIAPQWNIASKKAVDLKKEKRLKEYDTAIRYYLDDVSFENIVICDNSGYQGEYIQKWQDIALKNKKKLEYISYKWNTKSSIYGYGYGECEIIDYAFETSEILNKSETWFKITGRYILKDINTLTQICHTPLYFHKQGIFDSPFTVSTSFFKISNHVYKETLYKKHLQFYEEMYRYWKDQELILNGSVPVEKIWYFLLYETLKKEKIQYTAPVYYIFPQSFPTYFSPIFWENIRKILYFWYYAFWYDRLFTRSHILLNRLFFEKRYSYFIELAKKIWLSEMDW